jgi:hypothetical protein
MAFSPQIELNCPPLRGKIENGNTWKNGSWLWIPGGGTGSPGQGPFFDGSIIEPRMRISGGFMAELRIWEGGLQRGCDFCV